MTPVAELPVQVLWAVRTLARVNPLTPEVIASSEEANHLSAGNPKRVLKALLDVTTSLRGRTQYGRFRAALLIGTTIFGDRFLIPAERSGLLLAAGASDKSFVQCLEQLCFETAHAQNTDWQTLCGRLKTYVVYGSLVREMEARNRNVSQLLKNRPRHIVKQALIATELSFLREHLAFEIPQEYSGLIDELGSPEEIASITSLLIVLANDHAALDSSDFAFPAAIELEIRDLRELMIYAKRMSQQFEIAKYVSLFRYELEKHQCANSTFVLRPPYLDFEYFLRLGFVRAETNIGTALIDVAAKHEGSVISLRTAADTFAQKYRKTLGQVKDGETEWRRLRVNFPNIPELYNMIENGVFYEDLLVDEQLSKDCLAPLRYLNGSEIKLTEHLDLKTFHGAWRYLEFLSLVDIALNRPYSKSDPTVMLNSILPVIEDETMAQFVAQLGLSKEQAQDFLRLVSADLRHRVGYLDLQYRPALRIAQAFHPDEERWTKPEIVFLPAVVVTTNMARNLQAGNKLRFEFNAHVFVDVVAQGLKSLFPKVATNRPVKMEGATTDTDIDVLVFEGDTLFLFECKHSLPPTGPHELRDIWEDIEKGVRQLATATEILKDPARRQSYLTGWFPGTKLRDVAELKIVPCVLTSQRIFSGLQHNGVAIRDFGSLQRLCEDGVVGLGGAISEDEIVMCQFRVIHGKTMSGVDLTDYCSADSVFFKMFKPFMHAFSRIERLGGITIARETFVYEVELGEWCKHMEAIGCTREPDKQRKLTSNFAKDTLDEPVQGNEA